MSCPHRQVDDHHDDDDKKICGKGTYILTNFCLRHKCVNHQNHKNLVPRVVFVENIPCLNVKRPSLNSLITLLKRDPMNIKYA